MLNVTTLPTQTFSDKTLSKPNYPFVDWIRFVAMFSIVYEHSLAVPEGKPGMIHFNSFTAMSKAQQEAFLWISQPLKFGTICFFIISGYLLGKQLKSTKLAFSYYKKRLSVVGIPFLVAFLLFYLKSIGTFGVLIGRFDKSILAFPILVDQLWNGLFFTSYWFIFVFLLSLALMLAGWRYLSLKLVTILSFLAALFYAVNIYTNWIEPRHTFAFPAFVFYLCAGVWLSRHDEVIKRLQNTPNIWISAFLLLTFFMAVTESALLWNHDSIDPRNSLRVTNQLFSVAMFFWLLRNNYLHKLPFLNPRTESFGIYLYHLFFVGFIAKIIVYLPILSFLSYQPHYSALALAAASILRFLLAYSVTLLFVKLINQTKLKWLFGNSPS